MKLQIHKIIEKTNAEGPGTRFCIWVQGCSRHCDGCWAVTTWDFKGGESTDTEAVFSMIKNAKEIEGVTFLGGEPFEQAQALSELALKIKSINLSLVVFSGFELGELKKSKDKNVQTLLNCTDLLIDGAFEKENYDLSRAWVGSSNQQYHFLTDKYSLKDVLNSKNKIEVRISKKGAIFVNGMGDFPAIERKLNLQTLKNNI